MKKEKLRQIYKSLIKLPTRPKIELGQYYTPFDFIYAIFEDIYSNFNARLKEITIADLGAGTGLISIILSLLGVKRVYAIEVDKDMIKIINKNIKRVKEKFGIDIKNVEVCNIDINKFKKKVDICVSNPPFGRRYIMEDRIFFNKAIEIANYIYFIVRKDDISFYEVYSKENNLNFDVIYISKYILPKIYKFHKRKSKVFTLCVIKAWK